MQKNIGKTDRLLRFIVGAALVIWAAFFAGPTWAYIGLVPLLTAVFSRCLAYKLLGITTAK